eukprot:COSAG04_NODE_10155_length_800_cov_1.253923_2_plen_118_part_01
MRRLALLGLVAGAALAPSPPLHRAAADADVSAIRDLLKRAEGSGEGAAAAKKWWFHVEREEVDVRAVDERGRTALHIAAASEREGALGVVTALLKAGAEADAADREGVTPLLLAADVG